MYWQEARAEPLADGQGRARRVTAENLDAFAPLLARAPAAREDEDEEDGDERARRAQVDPAVAAAEALFAGKPFPRQRPLTRTPAMQRARGQNALADEPGQVFVQEIPRGGRRWQQGNVPQAIWREYFRAGEPRELTMVPVDETGRLGAPEIRSGGARLVSGNFGIEIGAARGRAYPAGGSAIRVVVPAGDRRFVYMLLMPGDQSYARAAALLDTFNDSPTRLRRALIPRRAAEDAWPESPLWAAARA
jgi:hypothetical protein